jgi:predicted 2-oxoglutarate/Fe(II)-dependent dioxygenase YbiX
VTWDKENQRVAWPMQRGDAILFHSEKRHGVNTVTKGMRHALVMELWEGADNANVVDRYS